MGKVISMENFMATNDVSSIANMGKALLGTSKTNAIVCIDGDLLPVLRKFLAAFDTVFGADWDFTKYQITRMENPETFLEPGVDVESDDWQNRKALLKFHHELLAELSKRQFKIIACTCPPDGMI